MELRIKSISEPEEKTSKELNEFNLVYVVFEYENGEIVCATASGKMIDILKGYSIGENVIASMKYTSKPNKKYKNAWYHDIRLIGIKHL